MEYSFQNLYGVARMVKWLHRYFDTISRFLTNPPIPDQPECVVLWSYVTVFIIRCAGLVFI